MGHRHVCATTSCTQCITSRQSLLMVRCTWRCGLLLVLLIGTLLQLRAEVQAPQGQAGPAVVAESPEQDLGPRHSTGQHQHIDVLENVHGHVTGSTFAGDFPTLPYPPSDQHSSVAQHLVQGDSQVQMPAAASRHPLPTQLAASSSKELLEGAGGGLPAPDPDTSPNTVEAPAILDAGVAGSTQDTVTANAVEPAEAIGAASRALEENANLPVRTNRQPILPLPPPDEFEWDSYADGGQADGFDLASMMDPNSIVTSGRDSPAIPLPHIEPAPVAQHQATDYTQDAVLPQDAASERRMNLALAADGASVVAANKEARKPEKTIDGDGDSYMKNLCSAPKWLVLELSQLGRVDEVQLLNKEMYSSRVRDFSVKGRQSHPRKDGPLTDLPRWFDTEHWQLLGNFTAANKKGEQTFKMQAPRRVRYLLFQFHTHYGSEEVCALNSISVLGVSAAQELEDALSRHLTGPEPAASSAHPTTQSVPPVKEAGTAVGAGQAGRATPATVVKPQQQKVEVVKPGGSSKQAVELDVTPPGHGLGVLLGPDGELLPVLDIPNGSTVPAVSSAGALTEGQVAGSSSTHAGAAQVVSQLGQPQLRTATSTEADVVGSSGVHASGQMVEGMLSVDPSCGPSGMQQGSSGATSTIAMECGVLPASSQAALAEKGGGHTGSKQDVGGSQAKQPASAGVVAPEACSSTADSCPSVAIHTDDVSAMGVHVQRGSSAVAGKSIPVGSSVSGQHEYQQAEVPCVKLSSSLPDAQAEPQQPGVIITPATSCPHAAEGKCSIDKDRSSQEQVHTGEAQGVGQASRAHMDPVAGIDGREVVTSMSQEHKSAGSSKDSIRCGVVPEQLAAPVNTPVVITQQPIVLVSSQQQLEPSLDSAPVTVPGKSIPLQAGVLVTPSMPAAGIAGIESTGAAVVADGASMINIRVAGTDSRIAGTDVKTAVIDGRGPSMQESSPGLLRFPSPDPMPTSVVDSLIAALEGGPAAKPKQAGNLFDLFKQEFVLLRVNQSRTWKYIHSLVDVLSHNTGHAAQQQAELERQLAAMQKQLAALPAQVEAAVLARMDHIYSHQLTDMAAQLASVQQQLQAAREREWAWTLYCSCLLSLLVCLLIPLLAMQRSRHPPHSLPNPIPPPTTTPIFTGTSSMANGHSQTSGVPVAHSTGPSKTTRVLLRFMLLVGVFNGVIGLLLRNPDLQHTTLLLLRKHTGLLSRMHPLSD